MHRRWLDEKVILRIAWWSFPFMHGIGIWVLPMQMLNM